MLNEGERKNIQVMLINKKVNKIEDAAVEMAIPWEVNK